MVKSKLLSLFLFIFGLYLIVSLSRNLFSLIRKGGEIKKENLKLTSLEEENRQLKEQLEFSDSQEFIEREARDKLGMAKEGEQVLVLPSNLGKITLPQTEEKETEIPNWKKWWNLFF